MSSSFFIEFEELAAQEKHSANRSFLRNVPADFRLSFHGVTVDESNTTYLSSYSSECEFLFNYGDLYLCVINAFTSKSTVDFFVKDGMEHIKELLQVEANYFERCRTIGKEKKLGPVLIDTKSICEIGRELEKMYSIVSLCHLIKSVLEIDELNNGWLEYKLTTAVSDDIFSPETTSSQEFKERAAKSGMIDEITVKISYDASGNEARYAFEQLYDFVIFDAHKLRKTDFVIKKCENCGRFFIPATRNDEKYCYFINARGKTCRQLGYETKLSNDEVLRTYRTIYKTQNARKQRNKKNISCVNEKFDAWALFAKSKLQECQLGTISLDELKYTISTPEWMERE